MATQGVTLQLKKEAEYIQSFRYHLAFTFQTKWKWSVVYTYA